VTCEGDLTKLLRIYADDSDDGWGILWRRRGGEEGPRGAGWRWKVYAVCETEKENEKDG
jgi:hypothetical protein